MGRKVHPVGFRIGVIQDWRAKWYADRDFSKFLKEDLELRRAIQAKYSEAGISQVEIERQANKVSVTIHTSRPGIVIGRGGQRVDEMRAYLENLLGKRIQLNIQEIRQPELDAYLVARVIAEQIQHRISYRRALKQAIFRTMQAGAKGIKVSCAGRLAGAEIARREKMHDGQVPLHTLRADIDYGFTEAHTTLGRIGIKVWIFKGEILPEAKVEEEILVESPAAEAPEASPAQPEVIPAKEKVTEEKAEAEVKSEVKPKKPRKATSKPKTDEEPPEESKEEVAEPKAEEAPPEEPKEATGELKAEKVAKPAKPKRTKTATAPVEESTEEKKDTKEEEKDATTQTGEISPES